MKTAAELKAFYSTELRQHLVRLEADRKVLAKRAILFIVAIVAMIGATIAVGASMSRPMPYVLIPGLGILVLVVLCYIYVGKPYDAYKREYKRRIIGPIVEFIDPNLSYRPEHCIPESVFRHAGIFRKGVDRYDGDDLVSGSIEDPRDEHRDPSERTSTHIEFSEVHAEYKTESRNSKGQRQTHWHTIFKGLLFSADFNKHFHGETFVLNDVAEKSFGWLGQKLQEWMKSHGELVKLEDAEFEAEFAVYSSDQVEARYILSPALMRRLLDFREDTEKQVQFSFVGSRVFVAIPFTEDLFEPTLFKSILDFESVRVYFEILGMAIGIVEDLNLNTRIWTKE